MDITEQLYMSTVQIISNGRSGSSAGTGFFFQYERNLPTPVLTVVTNKHIIENYDTCVLKLRSSADNSIVKIATMAKDWILHKDKKIDLAIFPVPIIKAELLRQKIQIHTRSLNEQHIPTIDHINNFSCIEDVLMVGYPDALIDEHNNMPIVRKGITATPIKYDYKGLPKFLIDASVYGGSSGSPVFNLKHKVVMKNGKLVREPVLALLGINHATHLHQLSNTSELRFCIPNGLGIIIKSHCLLDFSCELELFLKARNIQTHNLDNNK